MFRPPSSLLHLTSITFAHPDVPASRRARLALSEDALRAAYGRLAEAGYEAFVLSTCMRVEVAVAGDPDMARAALGPIFGDTSLADEGRVRLNEAAFAHMCRVAAGLESAVVGEPEVLAQFRQAVEVLAGRSASPQLKPVLERAVGVARSVRRLLGEASKGSLGTLAARQGEGSTEVAILGSGAMARAAVTALGGTSVRVFARRDTTVADHPTLPWSKVAEAFGFPFVISAVPAGSAVLALGDVEAVLDRRREPVVVVDLGMPPLGEQVSAHPSVRYIGIDELASRVTGSAPEGVDDALTSEVDKAWRGFVADDRVGSVIAQLMAQAETAVSDEVRRFANRVATSDDPEPILRQLAHTVARRILHPPISYVSSSGQDDAVDVLAEAFGVDP